ncbi:MAG: formate dehydrogenase subunit delta [Rhodocyclaceae bacterium]|nr:formate dehydrogenase subunit delta [Rhodocyclaceae bacterium]
MSHSSGPDNLIKMANQIGSFFDSFTDRELARNEVAKHLSRFWDPRMRRAIMAYEAEHKDGNALMPIVREALSTMPAPPPNN